MGRTHVHAPPGHGHVGRIAAVRRLASQHGHRVRRYPVPDRHPGWLVLVIKGPLPNRLMSDLYRSYDYLGLLD